MNDDRILSLLGFARKAGRISNGHDAAISSIVKNKAKLCLICSDASQRLKKEFAHACSYDDKNIPLLDCSFDMLTLSKAIGIKAAVVTVNDEGFAKKIYSLYTKND